MLKIHAALQSGELPNATGLSSQLEVSTKSVYRDLEFMRDRLGLPVEFDGTRNGYYYREPVAGFPTLQISEGELLAVLVAEKALQQYRGTQFEKPLLSALKKLERSLPETVSIDLAGWEGAISFRTSVEPIVNLEILDTLAKATSQRQQLQLLYRKPGATTAETRVVDPYHLANINGEWFLFAFDHLRSDLRTFSPSRMKQVTMTGRTFRRPRRFSIESELRHSFGVLSGHGEHRVVIEFSSTVADYIREKRWHPSQELCDLKSGGVELTLQLSSLSEVQRWILGWGGAAIAKEPEALRTSIRRAAKQIAESTPPSHDE